MKKLLIFGIIVGAIFSFVFLSLYNPMSRDIERFLDKFVERNQPCLFEGIGGRWSYNKIMLLSVELSSPIPVSSVKEARSLLLDKLLDLFESIKNDRKILKYFDIHPFTIKDIHLSIFFTGADGHALDDSLLSSVSWRESGGKYKMSYHSRGREMSGDDVRDETLEEAIERSGDPKFRRLLITEQKQNRKKICK